MKKTFIILIVILIITGCSFDKEIKDIVTTKTCTKQNNGYHETYKLTAINNTINKIELTYLYENSFFEVETLSTLTDNQKEQIKTNMLNTLGLESTTYEGFEVTIAIEDQMTVKINTDLTKAEPEILKKVGLDFSDTDMNIEVVTLAFESDGSTCK